MQTGAERQRAYRKRKGNRAGGKGGKNSKWDTAQFIAIDGEGESVGESEKFIIKDGKKERVYYAKPHYYTLLAASNGASLFNGGKRLDSYACLDFLLDLAQENPKAIFVIFAGSYDINHMLMYGFERDVLRDIGRGHTVDFEHENIRYQIEYRARKSLTIRRDLQFYEGRDGKTKMRWKSRIVLWDVFGFFQESFIGVIGKWLGKNHKHYELIKTMKQKRGDFASVEQSVINHYNAAELECLVELMDKVRAAIDGLGLKCRRWDGAGAVAAALMLKHEIKQFKGQSPPEVIEAARTAYAGGRIEVCKIGRHEGYVYDYDVNSAYPSVMAELPSLMHGNWIEGEGDAPSGFTLVHCKYAFEEGQKFYPLFYRTSKMQISFPSRGEGIYWYPEYEAALQCPGTIEVIKWWHFKPTFDSKPFSWIKEYYETRKLWVKNPTQDWQSGGEKIIKLGLNSLYGKTAQQLGGRDDAAPAYHQLEWAGYITSATRARLYKAAALLPGAIIGFATDGIFSTAKLPVECSVTKTMGAWELKEPVPVGMTIAMAGVYWWHNDDGSFSHYSRGFDKDSMKLPDLVVAAWKKGESEIDIPMQRLIGIGSACASDTLYAMRGRFTQGVRSLRLDGKSHKRVGINVKKTRPHLRLVDLEPNLNIEYMTGFQSCSFPYPLEWLAIADDDDYEKELEYMRELSDTENI